MPEGVWGNPFRDPGFLDVLFHQVIDCLGSNSGFVIRSMLPGRPEKGEVFILVASVIFLFQVPLEITAEVML